MVFCLHSGARMRVWARSPQLGSKVSRARESSGLCASRGLRCQRPAFSPLPASLAHPFLYLQQYSFATDYTQEPEAGSAGVGGTGDALPQMDLAFLNEQQRKAVTVPGGPVVILAGPGSGKTRVATTRVIWLIKVAGVRPEAIVMVTFTNKAASEMRNRVTEELGDTAGKVLIGTFHSICAPPPPRPTARRLACRTTSVSQTRAQRRRSSSSSSTQRRQTASASSTTRPDTSSTPTRPRRGSQRQRHTSAARRAANPPSPTKTPRLSLCGSSSETQQ